MMGVDNQGFTALHWAVFLGLIEVVEVLLYLGASVNGMLGRVDCSFG